MTTEIPTCIKCHQAMSSRFMTAVGSRERWKQTKEGKSPDYRCENKACLQYMIVTGS